jgi:hypothetical protein
MVSAIGGSARRSNRSGRAAARGSGTSAGGAPGRRRSRAPTAACPRPAGRRGWRRTAAARSDGPRSSAASGGGTGGGATAITSGPARSRAKVAVTSQPSEPGACSAVRTWTALPPRRSDRGLDHERPGRDRLVEDRGGRQEPRGRSSTAAAAARSAAVMTTPPDGRRKSHARAERELRARGADGSVSARIGRRHRREHRGAARDRSMPIAV